MNGSTGTLDAGRGVTAADGTTKAKIERAALTLFAEGGVDGVTTKAIAAAAGVSEGAIYRYFPSKEELAVSLFSAIHQRLTELVRAAASQGDGIKTKARAIVEAYCQTADDDWALFSFHLLSMHHFLPLLGETPDDPVTAVEDILKTAMAAGDIPKGDAALLAGMALGVVLQPALLKAYGRLTGDLSSHADAFAAGVLAVLNA